MKMSKATDYALVLLAQLAKSSNEEWVSVRSISEKLGIPSSFLSNIVHRLVQAGILNSQRGANGGVHLAIPTDKITIGTVMETMSDSMGLVDCIDHPGSCALESSCQIQRFWQVTHSLVLAALKHITVQDITMYLENKTLNFSVLPLGQSLEKLERAKI